MKFASRAVTHVGRVRELNEDRFLDLPEEQTWAVADGMGGHDAGEKASQAVVDALGQMTRCSDFASSLARLEQLTHQANDLLVHESENHRRSHKPGSTVASLLIQAGEGAVVWAGDSRVYRRRDGMLEQLTRDHSHVQQLVDRGLINADEAEMHPMVNVITRAVGIDIPLKLETRTFPVAADDAFLLCSDGLTHLVSDAEINDFLDGADAESDAVLQSLLQLSLARGAPDNVTLVYVAADGGEHTAAASQ